jgi:predicted Zn-dependent protease with MMP-like domain
MPSFASLERIAESEIEAALERLPDPLRKTARELPVICAGTPEDVEVGDDPDLLGLFCGAPLNAEFDEVSVEPTQIFLFLQNLWFFAEQDEGVFRREVRVTYLHELGHYFGWDEDDLAARGLE